MAIYGGTSGWAYASWKPGFYPKEVSPRRFLQHYASRLNSVEVNYTFRALPTADQLAGWMTAVPAGFRFSFKAPEGITHRRRLRGCEDLLAAFLASLEPVRAAGMLGAVLFQLPPNFKADVPRLADFLALPHLDRTAFEFRNESWFTDETWFVLREHNAAVCIAESDALKTPAVHTAKDFTCFRLRKDGGYDEADVAKHASALRKLAKERDVFAYYKHEDQPAGPLAAEAMLEQAASARRPRA